MAFGLRWLTPIRSAAPRSSVVLEVAAHDPSPGEVTYAFSNDRGELEETVEPNRVVLTMPSFGSVAVVAIGVDFQGARARKTLIIRVDRGSQHEPRVALLGGGRSLNTAFEDGRERLVAVGTPASVNRLRFEHLRPGHETWRPVGGRMPNATMPAVLDYEFDAGWNGWGDFHGPTLGSGESAEVTADDTGVHRFRAAVEVDSGDDVVYSEPYEVVLEKRGLLDAMSHMRVQVRNAGDTAWVDSGDVAVIDASGSASARKVRLVFNYQGAPLYGSATGPFGNLREVFFERAVTNGGRHEWAVIARVDRVYNSKVGFGYAERVGDYEIGFVVDLAQNENSFLRFRVGYRVHTTYTAVGWTNFTNTVAVRVTNKPASPVVQFTMNPGSDANREGFLRRTSDGLGNTFQYGSLIPDVPWILRLNQTWPGPNGHILFYVTRQLENFTGITVNGVTIPGTRLSFSHSSFYEVGFPNNGVWATQLFDSNVEPFLKTITVNCDNNSVS